MSTLQCARKPRWWHGGQPTQAATYRVNVRMKGPGPPPVGLRAAGCGCAVGWPQRVNRRLSCEYSSAPPEAGRGATANNNQALCGSVGAKKTMATMIVLLRAWYSHE